MGWSPVTQSSYMLIFTRLENQMWFQSKNRGKTLCRRMCKYWPGSFDDSNLILVGLVSKSLTYLVLDCKSDYRISSQSPCKRQFFIYYASKGHRLKQRDSDSTFLGSEFGNFKLIDISLQMHTCFDDFLKRGHREESNSYDTSTKIASLASNSCRWHGTNPMK